MQIDPSTDPTVARVTAEVSELERYAAGYAVTTPEQYTAGAEDLRRVKAAQKKLEETRQSLADPARLAWQRINDFFKAPAERLIGVELSIKRALTRYADEQARLQREEQRKAEEAAQRERERVAREAREAEAKAAELRRQAEEAAAAGNAKEAAKLESRAERSEVKADAKAMESAAVVAPVISREPPKVAGVTHRTEWKYEILDASKLPAAFLVPDERKIAATVRAMKQDAGALFGDSVRVYAVRSIASAAK